MKDSRVDTWDHIDKVRKNIDKIVKQLMDRGDNHDKTKLEEPEKSAFDSACDLSTLTYPSKEYDESKKQLDKALEHHYANNRHHPDHFPNGIKGMNLVDIIEMFCDWKAATLRQNGGNIKKSIQANQDRFGYSDELKQIFVNSVDLLE